MLSRLREIRSRYFNDLQDTEADLDATTGAALLTDTNAVEAEAEIAAAGEGLDPEIRSTVIELYRRCVQRYEYVKEANDKFLAMLDEGLALDAGDTGLEAQIREYAEKLTLDPIDQPMEVPSYEADDIIDEAQALTQTEAVLYGDSTSIDDDRSTVQ